VPPQSGQSNPPCEAPVPAQRRQAASGRRRASSRARAALARSFNRGPSFSILAPYS
jgi:hypothetical protein